METQHKKRISSAVTPLGNDLPLGLSLGDLKLLGQRRDQWMDWRKGKTPEPEWHKGKGKR